MLRICLPGLTCLTASLALILVPQIIIFFLTHSPLLTDPTAYRSLVGALQYMTFTRPNLSYAVQQASQFMSKPTQHNLIAAKRILRYLKGSLQMGIHF